jgi:transposase-like protein
MKNQQRNHRREEMFTLIGQWQQSGQAQIEFCKEKDITYTTFYYWLKRYRSQHEPSGGFIPMEVNTGGKQLIELRYPNGVILQLPLVDIKLIGQLVNL